MKRSFALLLLLAGMLPLAAAAPPDLPSGEIVLPVREPAPIPPLPLRAVTPLPADVLFVIQGQKPFIVIASPTGLVSITQETGPLRIRGKFVEAPEKAQSKVISSKYIVVVEAIGTGKCELLAWPVGATSEKQIVRQWVEASVGPPVPPVPPTPPVPPLPVPPAKAWVVVIEETVEASAGRGRFFTDAGLTGYLAEKKWKWRSADKDVKDASGKVPTDLAPYITRSAGKPLPQVFVVGQDGTIHHEGGMPTTPAELLAILRRIGGGS